MNEGFLVLDRDGDGKITSGREMFGNFTPLAWGFDGPVAENGFVALAWFDAPAQGGDGDGRITAKDAVYDLLRIWIDVNHDGITDPGELHTLRQLGIVAISTDAHESRRRDEYGNEFRFRSWARIVSEFEQGTLRRIFDVFLVHK